MPRPDRDTYRPDPDTVHRLRLVGPQIESGDDKGGAGDDEAGPRRHLAPAPRP